MLQRLLRALVVVLVGADEVGDGEEEVVRPEEKCVGRQVELGLLPVGVRGGVPRDGAGDADADGGGAKAEEKPQP